MGAVPQDLSGHVIVEGSLLGRGGQWRPLTQGVSPRAVLPPKRHRAVSGDICGCHDQGVPGMGGRGSGARDAARPPERPGRPLQERPTPGDTAQGGSLIQPQPRPQFDGPRGHGCPASKGQRLPRLRPRSPAWTSHVHSRGCHVAGGMWAEVAQNLPEGGELGGVRSASSRGGGVCPRQEASGQRRNSASLCGPRTPG